MKKVEAVIRPESFQGLRDELALIGIDGLTVTEAAGIGKQRGKQGQFRGTSFEVLLVPKLKIEMVIRDERLDEIVDVIIRTCDTNRVGDGKIFVSPVEEIIRIRTGERGTEAIL